MHVHLATECFQVKRLFPHLGHIAQYIAAGEARDGIAKESAGWRPSTSLS
jgi:hypothetical protein